VVAAKGEVVEKGHTVEQAQYGRNALAKVCNFNFNFNDLRFTCAQKLKAKFHYAS